MKIKEGYTLRRIGGEPVVMPDSEMPEMMIQLNSTGAALWQAPEEENDLDGLTAALTANYDVDAQTARRCAADFVEKLKKNDLLE